MWSKPNCKKCGKPISLPSEAVLGYFPIFGFGSMPFSHVSCAGIGMGSIIGAASPRRGQNPFQATLWLFVLASFSLSSWAIIFGLESLFAGGLTFVQVAIWSILVLAAAFVLLNSLVLAYNLAYYQAEEKNEPDSGMFSSRGASGQKQESGKSLKLSLNTVSVFFGSFLFILFYLTITLNLLSVLTAPLFAFEFLLSIFASAAVAIYSSLA